MYSLIAGADARNKSNPFNGFLHAEYVIQSYVLLTKLA